MAKVKKTPTEKKYSRWKATKIALRTTKYTSPFFTALPHSRDCALNLG